MTNSSRNNKSVNGNQVNQIKLLITQLADDTTLFIKNMKSFEIINKILNHCYHCARLRLNKEKTEFLPLGQTSTINLEKLGVKKVKHNIKSLGIILSKSMKSIVEKTSHQK